MDEAAASDVDPVVPETVEEDDVAGPERRARDGAAGPVLRRDDPRERDADPREDVLDEPGAVEARPGGLAAPAVRSAEVALRDRHDPLSPARRRRSRRLPLLRLRPRRRRLVGRRAPDPERAERLRPDDPVDDEPALLLERAHRRPADRPVDAVGRHAERALDGRDPPGADELLRRRRPEERRPRLRADDPVDEETVTALERPHRRPRLRTEDAVRLDAERPLHLRDRGAAAAEPEELGADLGGTGALRPALRAAGDRERGGDRRHDERRPGLPRLRERPAARRPSASRRRGPARCPRARDR